MTRKFGGMRTLGTCGVSASALMVGLAGAPAFAHAEQNGPGVAVAQLNDLAPPGTGMTQDQSFQEPTDSGTESPPQGGLEEIVVTARKRVETTQDVPAAVTAISPAQMARYDLSSLERVSAQTPSFSIGRAPTGSGATLVLRGIGSNSTSIGLEQSVAVIVDGIYYGQGRTINEAFFDLGRLEILKGPQALFFGKNATAGVVSLTTADPGSRLEVIGRLGYEFTAKEVIGEAIVSSPLTDTLGVRVSVRASKMFDGWFDQIGTRRTYTTTDRTTTAVPGIATIHTSDEASEGKIKQFYIRGTVKWEPTDRLTATLKANYGVNVTDNPAANSVLYRCPSGFSSFAGAADSNPIPCKHWFKSSANKFPAAIAATVPYARDNGELGNDYKSWAATANIAYEIADNVNLTWSNNYQYNRNKWQVYGGFVSANGPQNVFATERSTWRAYSSELRALTSFDFPVNLMIGGLLDDTKRDYLAFTASGGLENTTATPAFRRYLANSKDSETAGKTLAVFGQVIVKPTTQIEITGGARYTHEKKNSFFLQPYSHPIRVAQGIFRDQTTLSSKQKFTDWAPEATIAYKPTRDINIYAAYRTGYKSGGFSNSGIFSGASFNPPAGSPAIALSTFTFEPETAKGFEAGIKTELLDRQLRLNVNAYTYKYSDLQLDFFRSDVFAFVTINAGSARSRGVEAEFEFAPRAIDGFNLHGGVNYSKARYGSAISGCWGGQTQALGCNLVFVGPGETDVRNALATERGNRQNLKGRPTANAPKWTASLGATYEKDIGNSLKGGISIDSRFSDDYITSPFGNPFTRQNSYLNLDASLRVGTQDDRWQVALIGKNLTNRWYATGGVDAPNTPLAATATTGSAAASPIPADQVGYATLPRTIQIQATFRY